MTPSISTTDMGDVRCNGCGAESEEGKTSIGIEVSRMVERPARHGSLTGLGYQEEEVEVIYLCRRCARKVSRCLGELLTSEVAVADRAKRGVR